MKDEPQNDVNAWWGRIKDSEAFMQVFYPWWDASLEKLQPKVTDDPKRRAECIDTGRGFTLVEQKVPQLFFQAPELTLKPSPLMEGASPVVDPQTQQPVAYADVLRTHQDILNEKLGPDHIDAVRLWKRLIRDQVGVSGLGVSVMGYEAVTEEVEMPPQPGAILNLSRPVKAKVPIFQRCFWERLSPKKLLIPAGTTDSDVDKWPWVGYKWTLPFAAAQRLFTLEDDFQGRVTRDEAVLDHGFTQSSNSDLVNGVTIWYQAHLVEAVRHPLLIKTCTLIEGLKDFAEPPTQKYQAFDAQGRLTPDSLQGYPVIVQVARDVPDSPIPMSDVSVATPLINELNKFREQMVQQRDANIPLRWANLETFGGPEGLQKLLDAKIGGVIPGDRPLAEGDFVELSKTTYARENYTSNDYLDNDLARVTAIDANQSGAQTQEGQTATEAQLVQGASNVRLDDERARQLAGYVKAVTKYSVLVQKFVTVEEAAQIVGPARAQVWAQVMKVLPAALAFEAKPDSAVRVDQALERKRVLEEYTFFANDPGINRQELLRQTLTKGGWNATQLVVQPQPAQPEPPKPSFTFKGEDLNPALPQFSIVMEILKQGGFQISEQAKQEATATATAQTAMALLTPETPGGTSAGQPEHGGKVAPMESLDKHQAEETGGMQGSGAMAPMAPGGQLM